MMSDGWRTILIASLLLVAMSCGWFFFIYQPKVSRMQTFKDESGNILLKLRSMRVTEAQVTALKEQVASIKAEIAKSQRRIVPKDRLPDVVESVRQAGMKYGLKFLSILPDYQSLMKGSGDSGSDVLKLTIHMKMQGDYVSLGNFIESLASAQYYISVGELTVSYNRKLYPELDIIVDTQVYLRNELGAAAGKVVSAAY